MKYDFICPGCKERISTVYIELGGLVSGNGIIGSNTEEIHLLQTCAGMNGEDVFLPLIQENERLMTESSKILVAKLSSDGECIECGHKAAIKEFLIKGQKDPS